jgi:hypothetical protein
MMKKIIKPVVLVLLLVLALSGIAAAEDTTATETGISALAENLDRLQETTTDNDFDLIIAIIRRAVRELGSIPGNELIFYLARPYLAEINWYWLLGGSLISVAVFYALAVLLFTFLPGRVKLVGQAIPAHTGLVLGWGFLAAVVTVPAILLLAVTIIGTPLILLFIGAAGILGYTAIAFLVGENLLRGANPFAALSLGVLIVGLLTMVPVLGWLISLVLFIVALGAVLSTRFGTLLPQ